jgi:hypothetical protein
VLSLANVVDLFAHELSSLRTRRFAFASVLTRAFDCPFFRHTNFDALGLPPLDYVCACRLLERDATDQRAIVFARDFHGAGACTIRQFALRAQGFGVPVNVVNGVP